MSEPDVACLKARLTSIRRRVNPLPGSSYEDDEIGIICPACDYEIRKSIGWIRKHTQFECPGCGQMIDIESRNFRILGRTRSTDDP